jgi:hypothetical protein
VRLGSGDQPAESGEQAVGVVDQAADSLADSSEATTQHT